MSDDEQALFREQLQTRIAGAVEIGALGGGGLSMAGAITKEIITSDTRNEAYKDEQIEINKGIEATKKSKTLKRSIKAFTDVTSKLAGKDSKLYLNAKKAMEYFQRDDTPPIEDFTKVVPELEEQLERALELGGDLVLPVNKVFAATASGDFAGLIPEYRGSLESITDEELAEIQANTALNMDLAIEELGLTEGEAVAQNIQTQLINSGSEFWSVPRNAQAGATLYKSFFETMSQRIGDNNALQETLNRMLGGLTIKGPTTDIVTAEPQELTVERVQSLDAAREIKRLAQKKPVKRPKPLLKAIKERGGVAPGSPAAQELEARGFTKANARGLFKEGGVTDLDTLVFSELPAIDTIQQEGETGFATQDSVFDSLEDEAFGGAELTEEQQVIEDIRAAGIDLATATEDEIADLLEGKRIFEQRDGDGPRGSIEFENDETVINLFGKANQSTLLHETGHFFLDGPLVPHRRRLWRSFVVF